MKKLIIAILLIGSSLSAYGQDVAIDCSHSDGRFAQLNQRDAGEDVWYARRVLHLTFNFASAVVICPDQLSNALKEGKTINCAGTWYFDTRRPDDQIGTPVIVQLEKKAEKYSASFKTSFDYEREDVKLNCELRPKK